MSATDYVRLKCFLAHNKLTPFEVVQDTTDAKVMHYAPEIFNRADIDQSKRVILGPTETLSPEQRWEVETKWLMQHIKFGNNGLVVDFGCGIGRLSREINNPVLGVDISPLMRRHSFDYVGPRGSFCAASPEMFQIMVNSGLRISGLLTIWALAHVLDVEDTVNLLMRALRPGGVIWHLDLDNRSVPYRSDEEIMMGRDNVNPLSLLEQYCTIEQEIPVDAWPKLPEHDAGTLRKLRRKDN